MHLEFQDCEDHSADNAITCRNTTYILKTKGIIEYFYSCFDLGKIKYFMFFFQDMSQQIS